MGRLRALLWINVALIIHGSMYPWRFVAPASWNDAARHFLAAPAWTGVGDVAGNIVLFAPLGALGALLWRRRVARLGFFMLSAILAVALQVLQVYIPSRDAVLGDVVWNVAGLGTGMLLGIANLRLTARSAPTPFSLRAGPLVLGLLWVALEWWPFVPTLDWQHVKDALKPLLLMPHWNPRSVGEVSISVVVLGHVLSGFPNPSRLLAAVLLASAMAKLAIVDATLSISHVVGYVIGMMLICLLSRQSSASRARWTALLALAWYTFDELRPFTFSAQPTAFHGVPFEAMLEGSMDANALALVWNLFWLGAVLVPAIEFGVQPLAFAFGLAGWVAMLELVQCWLPGRSADITPALLPLLWALLTPAPMSGPRRHSA